MTHELGHVLLGDNSHAANGIMTAAFREHEFRHAQNRQVAVRWTAGGAEAGHVGQAFHYGFNSSGQLTTTLMGADSISTGIRTKNRWPSFETMKSVTGGP
jgi:hypothetical protein